VTALGQAATALGVEVGVLVDVDTGMKRTGVQPGQPTLELSQQVHNTDGLRYLGLMSWEGHTLAEPDETIREQEIKKSMALLQGSVQLCRDAGLPVTIVSGGGSGTANVTPYLNVITEIQAGGGVFCDVTYRSWGLITQPSLFVRATVTSRPAPERVIIDAGFKSLPVWRYIAEAPAGFPAVERMVGSAEHGVLTLREPDDPVNGTVQMGNAFDFMVGYGDATVFLHDHLYGIRNDVVEVVWPVVGRGKLR